MPTFQQLLKFSKRLKKRKKNKTPALQKNPHKKGICLKVYTTKPKKPNSANRKVAKVKLSNNRVILTYVPGEKAELQTHAVVLIQGRRVPDLPGIRYHLVCRKYDFISMKRRRTSHSKYGFRLEKKIF